jgi:hypothetical protein
MLGNMEEMEWQVSFGGKRADPGLAHSSGYCNNSGRESAGNICPRMFQIVILLAMSWASVSLSRQNLPGSPQAKRT